MTEDNKLNIMSGIFSRILEEMNDVIASLIGTYLYKYVPYSLLQESFSFLF